MAMGGAGAATLWLAHAEDLPPEQIDDALRDLRHASATASAMDITVVPRLLDDGDAVLVLVGWRAIDGLASAVGSLRDVNACVVGRLDEWWMADRGLSVVTNEYPNLRRATRLLTELDAVICTTPGLTRTIRSVGRSDAIYWPSGPHVGDWHGDRRRPALVLPNEPDDPDGVVSAWAASAGVAIGEAVSTARTDHPAVVVLPIDRVADRPLRDRYARRGFVPCHAWGSSPASVALGTGDIVRIERPGDVETIIDHHRVEARRKAELRRRAWTTMRNPRSSWRDVDVGIGQPPTSASRIVEAALRCLDDPLDPMVRFELLERSLDCGLDEWAASTASTLLELRREREHAVPSVRPPLAAGRTRRLWSTSSWEVRELLSLEGAPRVSSASPMAAKPPEAPSAVFDCGPVLGIRTYGDAPHLRIVRRRARLLVDEFATTTWWRASGAVLDTKLRLDGILAEVGGDAVACAWATENGRWSALFEVAGGGPVAVDLEFDVHNAWGPQMSGGGVSIEAIVAVTAPMVEDETRLLSPLLAVDTISDGIGGVDVVVPASLPPTSADRAIVLELRSGSPGVVGFEFDGHMVSLEPSNRGEATTRYRAELPAHLSLDAGDNPLRLTLVKSDGGGEVGSVDVVGAALVESDVPLRMIRTRLDTLDGWTDTSNSPPEERKNASVRWLGSHTHLFSPVSGALESGALVALQGPIHLGEDCLDGLTVSLNGQTVDRVALASGDGRWRWIGRLRNDEELQVRGLDLVIHSGRTRRISDLDGRRCSVLLERVGVGLRSSRTLFHRARRDLPYVAGSLFEENFGRGVDGVWIASDAQFWLDVPTGARQLSLRGDAAVSSDVVDRAVVYLDEQQLAVKRVRAADGSWELEASLRSLWPFGGGARRVRLEVPGSSNRLSLLLTGAEAR